MKKKIKSFAQHSLNCLRPFLNPIQPLFIKEYNIESTASNDLKRPNDSNFLNQLNQPKLNVELNQSQQQLLSFISNSSGVKFVSQSDSMVVEASMSLPLTNVNGQTPSGVSQNMKKRSLNQEADEQKEDANSNKRLQIDNDLANGNNLGLNQQKRSIHKASYEDDDEIEKQADADDDEDEEEEIFEDSENYEDLDEDEEEEEEDENEEDDDEEDEEEEDDDEEMDEDEETETLKKKDERPMETPIANGLQNTSKQNITNKANGSADENTEDFTEDDDDDDDIQEIDSDVEDSEDDFDDEDEDDEDDEQDEASKESDNKVEETVCEPNDRQFSSKEILTENVDSEPKSISSQPQNMQSSEVANVEVIVPKSKLEETNYSENSSNQNASLSTHENSSSVSSQLKESSDVQDAGLSQNNKENAEEEFDENKYMEMCSTLNTDAVLVESDPNVTLNNNNSNNLDNNNA